MFLPLNVLKEGMTRVGRRTSCGWASGSSDPECAVVQMLSLSDDWFNFVTGSSLKMDRASEGKLEAGFPGEETCTQPFRVSTPEQLTRDFLLQGREIPTTAFDS